MTREARDVFGLALEVLESNGLPAMDHEGYVPVQISHQAGARPMLDWALDYLACLPQDVDLRRLVIRAHMDPAGEWSRQQAARAGGAVRGFYRRLQARRLLGPGLRYLERMR